MKQKDIILYASIAGGAYLAYWYVTTYGPAGEVKTHGGLSYWDTWFGGAPAQTAAAPAQHTQQLQPNGQPVPSVYQQPVPTMAVQPYQILPPQFVLHSPAQLPPPSPPQPATTVRSMLLTASGGVNSLNADQWNYYMVQVVPGSATPDLFTPGNRGETFDVDTYLARRAAAGLSGYGMGDLVPVPTISSIPSMSFGGSLRGGANAWGQGNRGKGWVQ